MKLKKFNDVEKFYIDHHEDISAADLAKVLKTTEKSVQAYLDTKPSKQKEEQVKEEPKDEEKPKKKGGYRKPRAVEGSVVMDEVAAKSADDLLKETLGRRLEDMLANDKDIVVQKPYQEA